MAASAAIIGAVTAVVGTTHAISSSRQAKKEAGREKNKAAARESRLQADAKQKEVVEEANLFNEQTRAKQKTAASATGGRGDTILTGGLGGVSTANTGGKTLLGV